MLVWTILVPAQSPAAAARALGDARFARHDLEGALDAWNGAGEPRVRGLRIRGAHKTPADVVLRLAGIHDGAVLTRAGFDEARHRLVELPAATAAITYTPDGHGSVDVVVTLDENTLAPTGLFGLGAVGVEALFLDNIQVPISNLARRGEVWTTSFRWPSDWREFQSDLAMPSPRWLPGVLDVDGFWERETYGLDGAVTLAREDQTHVGLMLDDWVHGAFHWQGGISADQWNDRRHVGVRGIGDVRFAGDCVSIGTDDAAWVSNGAEPGFARGDVWIAWRSTPARARAVWTLLVEGTSTGVHSPLDLWTGAGEGLARPPLLRAHSLLEDNVIEGPVFGRALVHATGEYQHPVAEIHSTTLAWAAFVDTARAWHRIDGSTSPVPIDAGVGVRWTAPGLGNSVRLDLAHGLRDAGWQFTLGWIAAWPRQ